MSGSAGPDGPGAGAFAFANGFVNVVATLPTGTRVATAGRCGGMSYASLDHLRAGVPVPYWPARLFAPGRVPPDGHLVADLLQRRQLDSFRSWSALRFLTWSALPDEDRPPLTGVRALTWAEVPSVLRSLHAGRPVVLGLVVARGVLRSGDNHQVVAHRADRDASGRLRLHVLDPNQPGEDVTLVPAPDGWVGSDGRRWRGFFRHTYTSRRPPPLPGASRRPSAAVHAGDALGLLHVWSGRALAAHGTAAVVTPGPVAAWTVTPADEPGEPGRRQGAAPAGSRRLVDGDHVRLTRTGTGQRLSLAPSGPALAPAAEDVWRVDVDGGGPWRAGSRVRLVHAGTGGALRVERGRADRLPVGTGGVDDRAWWTVAERPGP
ncbi:hypothetical protein GC089_02250 [Cellulomonas sp. JZ18]|uniref:hypothetical protein n=1 Tax=Cellulomonas sp. JZ18 TaxID=2654191 RepID=UPI0012D48252|nr:hypothetical protein [Cellulomonas sp. JZ18]QGQ18298.1 hypothetical protein GC089_02250 [Cellulomonas sp. JZ18]